jgi:hypothetical protein
VLVKAALMKLTQKIRNVLQLRMDFNTFSIAGPSTLTSAVFYNLLGTVSTTANGQQASLATNCLTDTFTVTGSGGSSPPVICGTNSGYHSKLRGQFHHHSKM